MEIAWTIVGVVAALLVGVGVSVLGLSPPEYTVARTCFWVSALLLGGTGFVWELKTEQPIWWRVSAGILIWVCVGVGLPETLRWVSKRQFPQTAEALPTPSLVFVFGAPLGDNDSATWVMMLKHFGPDPAYNCNIEFFEDDRKNVEHQWLVKHPDSLFPPPGLAGESEKRVYVAEASPEGSWGGFNWNPLDPDRQHYSVTIDCRDGVFVENWEVTRVDGILRSRIIIERGPQWIKKNPSRDPVVFKLEDPEFIGTPLATELPKSSTGKIVSPGWKPGHRFEVPAAIIDSNGHIQIVSGIKQPDGSTLTDFGSWNILTKHFGDNPAGKLDNQ